MHKTRKRFSEVEQLFSNWTIIKICKFYLYKLEMKWKWNKELQWALYWHIIVNKSIHFILQIIAIHNIFICALLSLSVLLHPNLISNPQIRSTIPMASAPYSSPFSTHPIPSHLYLIIICMVHSAPIDKWSNRASIQFLFGTFQLYIEDEFWVRPHRMSCWLTDWPFDSGCDLIVSLHTRIRNDIYLIARSGKWWGELNFYTSYVIWGKRQIVCI